MIDKNKWNEEMDKLTLIHKLRETRRISYSDYIHRLQEHYEKVKKHANKTF